MPLTHTRELFAKALKGKYALGAFNVNNMELLQAIIEACEEEKAPVMLPIREPDLSQETHRGGRQPVHDPDRGAFGPRRFVRVVQGVH